MILDLGLSSSKVFITNNLDAFVQELDILFNTNYTELIGYNSFGSNYLTFLHSLQTDTHEIIEYTKNIISNNCTSYPDVNYEVSVNVRYDDDKLERIIVVEVTIYTDEDEVLRSYDLSKLEYT